MCAKSKNKNGPFLQKDCICKIKVDTIKNHKVFGGVAFCIMGEERRCRRWEHQRERNTECLLKSKKRES